MRTRTRIFFGRMAIVASVLGISLLGNLRSQASESHALDLPNVMASGSTAVDPVRATAANAIAAFGSDADDLSVDDDSASAERDDGHLVPAIYAWDPDVRFIYYRHVSKWM